MHTRIHTYYVHRYCICINIIITKEPSAFVLIITSRNGVCEIIDYRFVHLYLNTIRIENISAYIYIYIYYICEFGVFCFVEVWFFGLFKRKFPFVSCFSHVASG